MPLPPAVALGLDHVSALERGDHPHLETCALDLSLVDLRGLLLSSQNWLSLFAFGCHSHLFKEGLRLSNLLKLVLYGHSLFYETSS